MAEREGREKVKLESKNVLVVQSDARPVTWSRRGLFTGRRWRMYTFPGCPT